MIITLIFVFLVMLGFILINTYIFISDELGLSFIIIGSIGTLTSLILILMAHAGVKNTIAQNQIEYWSLLERQQVIVSEYEDYSKSDVMRDIANWNKDVVSYKYWANNPWTSWYFSKEIADNVKTIELK